MCRRSWTSRRRRAGAARRASSSPAATACRSSPPGPSPTLLEDLDQFPPARDLARQRRRYFIGVLDPCASAEVTRGCPWDCSFCSAWTFYWLSYRKASAEAAAEDFARIEEP